MERPGLALRCAGAPRPGITGLRVDGCVRGPHRSVQQQETSVHEKQLNVSHGHMTEAARWRRRGGVAPAAVTSTGQHGHDRQCKCHQVTPCQGQAQPVMYRSGRKQESLKLAHCRILEIKRRIWTKNFLNAETSCAPPRQRAISSIDPPSENRPISLTMQLLLSL